MSYFDWHRYVILFLKFKLFFMQKTKFRSFVPMVAIVYGDPISMKFCMHII